MSNAAAKLFDLMPIPNFNPLHPDFIEVTRAAFPLKLDIIFSVKRSDGGIVAIGKAGPMYYSTWIKPEGNSVTGGYHLVFPKPGMMVAIPSGPSLWQRIRAAVSRAWSSAIQAPKFDA